MIATGGGAVLRGRQPRAAANANALRLPRRRPRLALAPPAPRSAPAAAAGRRPRGAPARAERRARAALPRDGAHRRRHRRACRSVGWSTKSLRRLAGGRTGDERRAPPRSSASRSASAATPIAVGSGLLGAAASYRGAAARQQRGHRQQRDRRHRCTPSASRRARRPAIRGRRRPPSRRRGAQDLADAADDLRRACWRRTAIAAPPCSPSAAA